jgi:hypothetical protein
VNNTYIFDSGTAEGEGIGAAIAANVAASGCTIM